MPMGDKQWLADQDRADRIKAQDAAQRERSAARHAANMDSINRETERLNNIRAEAAQNAADQLRREQQAREQEEAERRQAHPVVPVKVGKKKSGFGGFLFLAVVLYVIYHIATKNDPTPVSEPQTALQPNSLGAPPRTISEQPPIQKPEESSATNAAAEPLTELPDTPAENLPFFMTRPVVESDLEGKTPGEIILMAQEVMARHGAGFTIPEVQSYFEAKPWYHRSDKPLSEIQAQFTDVEQQNLQFLQQSANARR